jgi:N-acetylglucosaminyl-diphospho-decaprenol L-rhamnosyltransferase
MSEIGIVVVTYNSAAHIGSCLDAALTSGADIVVVDNASSDATVNEVTRRGVPVVANRANLGFAAAVNQGFEYLKAPYVLLLNPDTELTGGLEALRLACGRPHAAGASGLLNGIDGRAQVGFMVRRLPTAKALALEALLLNRVWPGNPVNRAYRALDLDPRSTTEVEQPAGAFLMIRRNVWKELGGLDEGFYPLWFEDVDFCRRARDAGYRFYYEPAAVAKHVGGYSISSMALGMRPVYWYGSLLRYTIKHFRPAQAAAVSLCVIAGSVPRMVLEAARHMSLRPLAAYGKVVRLAAGTLLRAFEA